MLYPLFALVCVVFAALGFARRAREAKSAATDGAARPVAVDAWWRRPAVAWIAILAALAVADVVRGLPALVVGLHFVLMAAWLAMSRRTFAVVLVLCGFWAGGLAVPELFAYLHTSWTSYEPGGFQQKGDTKVFVNSVPQLTPRSTSWLLPVLRSDMRKRPHHFDFEGELPADSEGAACPFHDLRIVEGGPGGRAIPAAFLGPRMDTLTRPESGVAQATGKAEKWPGRERPAIRVDLALVDATGPIVISFGMTVQGKDGPPKERRFEFALQESASATFGPYPIRF